MDENQSQPAATPGQGQTVVPNVPEQPAGQPQGGSKKKLWIGLAIIIILGALGWTAYAQYYSPARVWQKFIGQPMSSKVLSEDFSFSYQDNGKAPTDQSNQFIGMFTDLKFSVNGTAYEDITDANNPQINMGLNYTFGSGDTSMSAKANLVMLGQDIYINFGNNPFINSMLSYLSPDQKIEWLKINAKEIQEASGTGTPVSNIDYAKQEVAYQTIIQKYLPKVILKDKLIDRQAIHGVQTMHYSNKLDKTQAKAMMHELLDVVTTQMATESTSTKPEDIAKFKDIAYSVVDNILDRTQISGFETWVGTSDYQLHKIKYTASVPSLVSIFAAASKEGDSLATMDPQVAASHILDETTFDGVLNMDQEIYDIGKKQQVTAPDNAFDVAKKIKEQASKPVNQVYPAPVLH